MAPTYILAALLFWDSNPVTTYFRRLVDPTFRGLYQANAFDLAIMLPYFLVMAILAMYGLHRYALVYHYFKNRKNVPGPPLPVAEWPKVTVQLPIYNERYVIERLIETVAQFDYPRELLDIQVLDDSTDQTQQVARDCVERHQALGIPITYIHRDNREGFKAGALQEGLKSATGEFVAIFDADFIPPADFLRRTVPYFTNSRIAMVQTRWSYVNRNYSQLTEVEAILLDGHFAIEHSARFRSGLFFNFNGTAGIWRRCAIEDAGGWQHDTLTEDTDLSYRAQIRGWKFLYLPEIDCPSELPVEMNAFKSQQARWAKGLMQTAKKILPQMMRSDAPPKAKAEAFFHLTANISYPLMVFLSIILLPAMIVRFYQGWFQVLLIDLPAVPGFDLLDFVLLSLRPARVLSEDVAAHVLLFAVRDGRRHRPLGEKRRRGDRSDLRREIGIRAHAKIQSRSRRQAFRRLGEKEIPQERRLDALGRSRARNLFRRCRGLQHPKRELPHRPVPASVRLGLPLHRHNVLGPNLRR